MGQRKIFLLCIVLMGCNFRKQAPVETTSPTAAVSGQTRNRSDFLQLAADLKSVIKSTPELEKASNLNKYSDEDVAEQLASEEVYLDLLTAYKKQKTDANLSLAEGSKQQAYFAVSYGTTLLSLALAMGAIIEHQGHPGARDYFLKQIDLMRAEGSQLQRYAAGVPDVASFDTGGGKTYDILYDQDKKFYSIEARDQKIKFDHLTPQEVKSKVLELQDSGAAAQSRKTRVAFYSIAAVATAGIAAYAASEAFGLDHPKTVAQQMEDLQQRWIALHQKKISG